MKDRLIAYNTSFRVRDAEDTLVIAQQYAERYGITRVTDTTLLDTIGVPVCASIRPDADRSSLCVCAGKGLLPIEARVGAYMEAIEFALAEPRNSHATWSYGTIRDILDSKKRTEAILDFCPRMDAEFELDDPIAYTTAVDLLSLKNYLIPAELAFMPFRPKKELKSYFGYHTNGLASGNSAAEASMHGILEVVERDILSFQMLERTAARLSRDSYPDPIQKIHHQIEDSGMELLVNYVYNAWELPFFSATILDHTTKNPLYINGGYGCHFRKSIALTRAVTEAIQSRMTFIHGSRDDVIDDYERYASLSEQEKLDVFQKNAALFQKFHDKIAFDKIAEPDWNFAEVEIYLNELIKHLNSKGIDFILRVNHTKPDEPLQVVKIVIPTMEFFTPTNARVGLRLRDHAEKVSSAIIRRP